MKYRMFPQYQYNQWASLGLLLLLATSLFSSVDSLVPRSFVKREIRRTANAALGGAITAGVLATLLRQQQEQRREQNRRKKVFRPTVDSMAGQVVFITGGTAGLGLESAKRLAIGGPTELIISARSHTKGQTAVQAIQDYLVENKVINDCRISYKLLDLDSLQGIRNAVASWIEPTDPGVTPLPDIDVLINNAGILAPPFLELTEDGIERQMASNHLGHFLLTSLLVPKLKGNARIINVSSEAHQMASSMDFDYIWKGGPNYQGIKSYGQSKLANIYFSQQLYQRAQADGKNWDVAIVHPGGVQTGIFKSVVGLGGQDSILSDNNIEIPEFVQDNVSQVLSLLSVKPVTEGANTHVFLGSGAAPQPWKAAYYVDCMPQKLEGAAVDIVAAQRLWEESEELAGLRIGGFFDGAAAAEEEIELIVPEVME